MLVTEHRKQWPENESRWYAATKSEQEKRRFKYRIRYYCRLSAVLLLKKFLHSFFLLISTFFSILWQCNSGKSRVHIISCLYRSKSPMLLKIFESNVIQITYWIQFGWHSSCMNGILSIQREKKKMKNKNGEENANVKNCRNEFEIPFKRLMEVTKAKNFP